MMDTRVDIIFTSAFPTVKDYSPFVDVWSSPADGLRGFLIHFLDDAQDISFQHIGVWTIEQFLEGNGK